MRISTALTALSLFTLAGCATGSADSYMDRGDHGVGMAVHEHDGLTLKTWYPTETPSEASTYDVVLKFAGFPSDPMPMPATATIDATPTDGKHPLVVLSHGFGLNPEWYSPMAEHLASHGFVVVGPEHTEGDWYLDVVAASVARPLEVSTAIDFAEDGALAAVIDAERVAVVGHSYGGYTALAAAGARFDLEALSERCEGEEDPFLAGMFCAPFVSAQQELASEMGLDDVPTGLWPSLADDRVDAIVPIASDAFLFGDDGLASVDVPALFIGGTADTSAPMDWGTQQGYDHISSEERYLVAMEGGEHMLATVACEGLDWMAAFPQEYRSYFCFDPAWDKHEAHDVLNQLTTAFLLHVLEGDRAAEKSLRPGLYTDERLRFERL